MTAKFGQLNWPVDRSDRPFVWAQLAVGPTPGTRGPWGLLRCHCREMPLLNLTAELLPKVMCPQLDNRIVGHPLYGAVGSIKSDRDLRGFGEQTGKFFL